MDEDKLHIDLWTDSEQGARGEKVADRLFMNPYEYIRRAVDSQTSIVLREPEDKGK